MKPTIQPVKVPLYESVADRIADMIDAGSLPPATRAPSVRKLAGQLNVSIATVVAAYRLLEDRGLLEARPQSGFYVRRPPDTACEPMGMTSPSPAPGPIETSEMGYRLLQEYSPNVVPLGAALGAISVWPIRAVNRIMSSIARSQPLLTGSYDNPPGNPLLRRQIARRAVDAGCSLRADDIVITCGSLEAIHLCLRAVAKPGDTIAIESPTYFGILQTLEMLGMKALEIPTCPTNGISLDALELALRQRLIKACVLIPTVNNPLGSIMPEANKRRVVEMLDRAAVPLIEDDNYGELTYHTPRPPACKAFDRTGNVLLCSGFSKTISAGLRVGWCAPGRWTATVARQKAFLNVSSPTLPQLAIAQLLSEGGFERYLRKVRAAYRQQVQRMSNLLATHFPPGTRVSRPQGGFVLWVEMPAGVCSLTLHDLALARGISVSPGIVFGARPEYRNCLRLNCGMPWNERVEWAIAELGQLITQLAHHQR